MIRRWTPTPDQITILKDFYHNKGVRSPNPEDIHKMCLLLKQHGNIERKNVFYWYQNHKARERQKKRLLTTNSDDHNNALMQKSSSSASVGIIVQGVPVYSASACGTMKIEKSFKSGQDCSICCGGGTGISYTHAATSFDMKDQSFMEQEEEIHHEIETLPLFPMHGDEGFIGNTKTSSEVGSGGSDVYNRGGARSSSLELCLNSYGYNTHKYY